MSKIDVCRRRFVPRLLAVLVVVCSAADARTQQPERRPRVDAFGDPLPERAVARIGTVRFRPGSQVWCVTFSPDGKFIVSGGEHDSIRFWDPATGKEIGGLPDYLGRPVYSLAFAPDGRSLASGKWEGETQVWDIETGEELCLLGKPGEDACWAAYSPDGKVLAVSFVANIRVWDTTTWKEMVLLQGHQGGINHIAFARDTNRLVSGDLRGGLRVWDLTTGNEWVLEGEQSNVCNVAISPDGSKCATVGDAVLAVWDVESGEQLHHVRVPRVRVDLDSVSFSPDGETIATTGRWGGVRLWDATTGEEVGGLGEPGAAFGKLAFSPDGKRLVVAAENSIRLWDLDERKEIVRSPGVSREAIHAITFSPDGRRFAFVDKASIRLHQTSSLRELWRIERDGWVARLAFGPDGNTIAGWAELRLIFLDAATGRRQDVWEGETPELLRVLDGCRGSGVPTRDLQTVVVWHPPDVTHLPTMDVYVRDAATGEELERFQRHEEYASAAAISPDGRFVAFQSWTGLKYVYPLPTGRVIELQGADATPAADLAFSPDGRTLAASGHDGTVRVWELSTGRCRALRHFHTGRGGRLAFSPDGRVLASWSVSGSQSSPVTLWEPGTGRELGRLVGHRGAVTQVAFAPDGNTLATASEDTTVLLWDIADLVRPARPTALTTDALTGAWDDLADADAAGAFAAMTALQQSGSQAVDFLRPRLLPVRAPSPEQLAGWLKDLDQEEFAVREQAAHELEKRLDLVAPALRKALADGPSPEVRRRLTQLIETAETDRWSGDALRTLRAIEVLERLGSPEAQRVLESLAGGAAESRLTREAKASLQRLAR
jgi:WD40 repeat protein